MTMTDEEKAANEEKATTSPLNEAEVESLDELMTRIDTKIAQGLPREIVKQDISRVVDYLVSMRERFLIDEMQNKRAGTSLKGSKKQAKLESVAQAIKEAQEIEL